MMMTLDGNNIGRIKSSGNKEPAKINLGLNYLSIFCKYVLQDIRLIRMEHLVNLKRLLLTVDKSTYENSPEQVKRMGFLFKALEARLDYNLTDNELIITHINGGVEFEIDFIDYNNIVMTKAEVQWCHNLIENLLKYSFFFNESNNLQELLTRFKTVDMSKKVSVIEELEVALDRIKNEFRKTHVEQNLNDVTFSLDDGTFESAITDTYNLVTNPSRRLVTGMQGFNEMIGGGFESGRVYMILGVAGVGKSLTLLNLVNQIKKYNTTIKPKDPSKTPCVVLLTMENTVVETITRMFDMVVDKSKGMGNYNLNEVIDKMKNEGGLTINNSSPLDIVIKYKPNRSISTDYLYTLYDDLLDSGKEMVCCIQDHIKRIRSVDYNQDLRLELGDIVNELKVFAAEKDIPVITVSHLNREATRIIEEAAAKGKVDSGRLIGKSNTGESLLMIDNLDCGITIAKDYDKDNKMYMTFHRIKMRDKGSTVDYIAQPFYTDNPIKLVEDVGTLPQFKVSLHTAPMMNNQTNIKMTSASCLAYQNLLDNQDKDEDKESNINNSFNHDSNSSYELKSVAANDNEEFINQDKAFDDDISNLIKEELSTQYGKNIRKPITFNRSPIIFEDKFTVDLVPLK